MIRKVLRHRLALLASAFTLTASVIFPLTSGAAGAAGPAPHFPSGTPAGVAIPTSSGIGQSPSAKGTTQLARAHVIPPSEVDPALLKAVRSYAADNGSLWATDCFTAGQSTEAGARCMVALELPDGAVSVAIPYASSDGTVSANFARQGEGWVPVDAGFSLVVGPLHGSPAGQR